MPDCDVAVIGAGVIGEAVAYELVSRGASVTLIDARGAGLGSTQAAAGMLVPFLEGFGGPLLPLATRSLEMYDAFIERVTRDSGVGVGYRRGRLAAGRDRPMSMPTSCGRMPPAAPPGVDCELLDARRFARRSRCCRRTSRARARHIARIRRRLRSVRGAVGGGDQARRARPRSRARAAD